MTNTVEILPTKPHTASVIFLHGLGGNGDAARQLIQHIIDAHDWEHVKFIFPSAPSRELTFLNGFRRTAWYDIKVKMNDYGRIDPFSVLDEDTEGIDLSSAIIHSIIESEIERGIPSARILIGGVSMGGSLAIYSALTYYRPLAGILTVNSYLPLARTFLFGKVKQPKHTPLVMCHGQRDQIVNHFFGRASYLFVATKLKYTKFHSYPELDHYSSNEDQVKDISTFMNQLLKQDL
jgi:predicted esterase